MRRGDSTALRGFRAGGGGVCLNAADAATEVRLCRWQFEFVRTVQLMVLLDYLLLLCYLLFCWNLWITGASNCA